ncbi:B2L15 protein, partial [Geococcyx californianus]|nr:B2L15 protein [Geococcyx californianus]
AAMASFEEQTEYVVEALFSDLLSEEEADCRSLEMDSGGPPLLAEEPPTMFDPIVIASRLRQMGDQCNIDFERFSSEPLADVLKGKMERLGAAVDSLVRSCSDQIPELVYGKAFLCAAVKLLMYLTEKVPAVVRPSQFIGVINGNPQVRSYIEACGGWVRM